MRMHTYYEGRVYLKSCKHIMYAHIVALSMCDFCMAIMQVIGTSPPAEVNYGMLITLVDIQ